MNHVIVISKGEYNQDSEYVEKRHQFVRFINSLSIYSVI